jgi:phosphatidylglycerol:prolipoprotein diacylglycerol transferase
VIPIVYEVTIGGATRPIGGYGLAISIGMLLTGALTARAAWRARGDVGATIACCGYTIVGGLAGAWLAHFAVESLRTGAPLDVIRTGGGLVFYGAVPGGVLAAFLGARALGVPFAKTVDLSIPGIAAGHAIGRLGCFFGGCCYGVPHDGFPSVTFTHPLAPAAHPPVPRHPVQLYESAGLLALAFAFALVPIGRADGSRALAYVVAYAALRFSTEAIRGDVERGVWGPLSTSQLVSIALVAAGVPLLFRLRRAR